VSVADEIVTPDGAKYEVLGHLGRGTFGQVLKVRTADNQIVALKVIRNRHAFRKQAEVEVQLLQRLQVCTPMSNSCVLLLTQRCAAVTLRHLTASATCMPFPTSLPSTIYKSWPSAEAFDCLRYMPFPTSLPSAIYKSWPSAFCRLHSVICIPSTLPACSLHSAPSHAHICIRYPSGLLTR
jgi:hypothetical protein